MTSLACLDTPPPPCDGCDGTCADVGAGPACLPAATGCVGCGGTQSCVLAGGAPTCATRATPGQRRDVPLGVGVFASLAFRHDEALVAAMRRAVTDGGVPKGELVGWSVSADGAPSSAIVLDAAGDTGYFPDLKVDASSGRVAVGYHDASSRAFKLYLASSLSPGVASELVDSGKDTSGTDAFVGADSAVVFLPDGGLMAVYQDATRGDLKLARRSSTWTIEAAPMSSAGAVGFFADAVFTDGALYVSHARLRARTVKTTLRLDTALLLERRAP